MSRLAIVAATFLATGVLAVSSMPSVAMAQGKVDKKAPSAAPAAKVKKYDFTADTLEGELIKPDGTAVDARTFGKSSSLIRIRRDFIAEILKSAQDI